MATNIKIGSDNEQNIIPSAKNMRFGIVVSEWHKEISDSLLQGAYNTLIKNGAKPDNIEKRYVPGSFELTLGGQFFAEYMDLDAIICIGCIIKGETPHFDYVCQGVTYGITQLNIDHNIPFIFCVLTTDNIEQAMDRAGGKYGNKGEESAIAAIKMVALQEAFLNDEEEYYDEDEEEWDEDWEDEDEIEDEDDEDEFDEDDEDEDDEDEDDKGRGKKK